MAKSLEYALKVMLTKRPEGGTLVSWGWGGFAWCPWTAGRATGLENVPYIVSSSLAGAVANI